MEKLTIPYPVVVEGKYDRLRLLSVLDATVYTTDGFAVFNRTELMSVLRALTARTPVILLTDSDGAGKLIRSHLTGALPADRLIQLYVPQIRGKERRKAVPSKEGFLGVEGMEAAVLYDLFRPYAVAADGTGETAYRRARDNPLCKADLYRDGLSGRPDSAAARDKLAERLALPAGMTANALLAALKVLLSYEDYLSLVGRPTDEEEI